MKYLTAQKADEYILKRKQTTSKGPIVPSKIDLIAGHTTKCLKLCLSPEKYRNHTNDQRD